MARLLESQENQGRLIREYERTRDIAANQAMNEWVQTKNLLQKVKHQLKLFQGKSQSYSFSFLLQLTGFHFV